MIHIRTHIIDVDAKTCARCGEFVTPIKTGELSIPHRQGEVVATITGEHFFPVSYRPKEHRYTEDPCE